MEAHTETFSAEHTKKLAASLIKEWMKPPFSKRALVIGFEGELGSGKTTFIQGAIHALGVKNKVTSPTFVLMKRYKTPGGRNLYHIDCYRLSTQKDLLSLGWRELIQNPENTVFVEWADRVKKILPPTAIVVRFQTPFPQKRSIEITIPKLGN